MPAAGSGGYVRIAVVGDARTAAELMDMGRAVQLEAHRLLLAYGAILQREVKARASGPPGPAEITGDYVASIRRRSYRTLARGRKGGGSRVEVGTDSVQGWRLEMGFHGVDALDRHFHQEARPHFGPAFDAVKPMLESAFEAMVNLL